MSRHHSGFTLIEVLIAITLLSVMMVLLFASLRIAAASWDASEDKISQVNRRMVAYQFFKRHLADIRPMMTTVSDQDSEQQLPVFRGTAQSLTFVASMPASATRKGLQIFYIAPDRQNPQTLQVRLRPFPSRRTEDQTVTADLLHDVTALRFSYFGKTDPNLPQGQWQEQWLDQQGLPSLIKVSIRLKNAAPWLDMLLPLRISGLNQPEATGSNSTADSNGPSIEDAGQ